MAQQGNRVGQRLGNYQFERLLGRGGFAEVYLGSHVRLQRPVAIKVLHTILSEKEIEEFEREARTIAALSHPNIVQVFDFDVQEGVPFLVMDYLPNGTLRQRHNKGEHVPLPTVISYVKQIADALQYAHEQRLIHRDIKPENMLIGRRGEIVLSDFGIAAIAHGSSSMTQQSVAGTIYYMAPEQLQSHPRPASDQYAFGIVTYEWLCGERPFDGSYAEIFGKHLMTPPPSLLQKVPGIPQEVEQVVFTALAKKPEERFKSVQAYANALTVAGEATQQASEPVEEAPEKTVIAAPSKQLPTRAPILDSQTTPTPNNLTTLVTEEEAAVVLTPPQTPVAPPKRSARKISRRTAVIGLAALEVLALSGGIVWVALNPHSLDVYWGHSSGVNAVAWSLDGKLIASGSDDNTVQVWNVADGGNVFTYKAHTSRVSSVVWSPDGKLIASGSDDNTVKVWILAENGSDDTYTGHANQVNAVAWSPDGTRIASGGNDNTVQIWNTVDYGAIFTYKEHTQQVNAVAWSPDGKRIASGSNDKTVRVWNAIDGGNTFIYNYNRHFDAVNSAAWSPSGTRIASGSNDKTVQVWNAGDGGNVFTYQAHSDRVNAVAWSPDGKRIASGSGDSTVQVWNAADGGNVFTYQGHSAPVNAVAWSPDGTRIASGSADKTVQVWTPQ